MEYPTVLPPHRPWLVEVLRAAGMSQESQLSRSELVGARLARSYLADHPGAPRNVIYRMIRPRRDDEYDD